MYYKCFKIGNGYGERLAYSGVQNAGWMLSPWYCGLKFHPGTGLSSEVDTVGPQQLTLVCETIFSCLFAFLPVLASGEPGWTLRLWFWCQRLGVDLLLHLAHPRLT